MSNTDKDDEVSRAYRAAAHEEPPAALDDAIRAAARRAVQARPQATTKKWVPRWGSPVAAAAVIMLAVSLLFVARQEAPEVVPLPEVVSQLKEVPTPALVPEVRIVEEARKNADVPPPPKMAAAPSAAAPASNSDRVLSVTKDKAVAAESERQYSERRAEAPAVMAQGKLEKPAPPPMVAAAPVAAPPAASPSAFPAAPPPPMAAAGASADHMQARDEAANTAAPTVAQMESKQLAARKKVAESQMQSFARKEAAGDSDARRNDAPVVVATPGRSAPAAAAPMVLMRSAAPPLSSADWLKRIEELRAQGKLKEAREELAKFRKQHPDVVLPKALAELPAE